MADSQGDVRVARGGKLFGNKVDTVALTTVGAGLQVCMVINSTF